MFEEDNAQWGLVHALVLDGKGGARSIARTELDDLQLQAHESLWLHWDCLLYTSPSPRDRQKSRMPSSA